MAQTVKLLKGIRCSNSGKTIYTRIFLEGEIEGHTFTKILLKNENPCSRPHGLFNTEWLYSSYTDIQYKAALVDFEKSLPNLLKEEIEKERAQAIEAEERKTENEKAAQKRKIENERLEKIEAYPQVSNLEILDALRAYEVEQLPLVGQIITEINGIEKIGDSYQATEPIKITCKSGDSYLISNQGGYMGAYGPHTPIIEDFNGDIEDLIGNKILIAECRKGLALSKFYNFYTLATIKGYVDIRFSSLHSEYYGGEVFFEPNKLH